jgi:hypothetical protein
MQDYSHIDLVCRVSANHVQNRKPAARMHIDPFSEMQDISLVDKDWLTIIDLSLDLLPGDNLVSRHCCLAVVRG